MKNNKIMKKKLFLFSLLSFTHLVFSQIGIGTETPDPSSILDINVSKLGNKDKKGLLFPKVTLQSINDKTTIPNPAVGLVIYNTGNNASFSIPGFYFWNGTEWRLLDSSSGINPSIKSIQCGSAMLTPPRYEAGIPYFGTITLPYTMGNGGKYFSGDTKTINGLSYVLQAGELNYGNGNFYYTVTGTPAVSSPEGSLFELSFLDKTCKATLGDLNEIKSIQYARKYTTIAPSTPDNSVTSIGNIKVRYNGTQVSTNQDSFIEFSPLQDTYVTIKYDKAGEGGQNLQLWGRLIAKKGNWYKLADKTWPGDSSYPKFSSGAYPDLNSGLRDLGTVLIVFHNTQEIYRISLNVNGQIAKQSNIKAIPAGVTIFIEKLE